MSEQSKFSFTIGICLPEKLVWRIEQCSEALSMTKSEFCRAAIREKLDHIAAQSRDAQHA
jgi:metal-responsive CopG/Arc/MetJ family transcriptional regulator